MTVITPEIALVSTIIFPFIVATAIYVFSEFPKLRDTTGIIGSLISIYLTINLYQLANTGQKISANIVEIMPNLSLEFEVSGFGLIYAMLASFLWFVALIYSYGYLQTNKIQNQTRFYIFYSIAIACSLGIAFSANLLTMFIFYEILTLSTYPLVTHHGDAESKKAGRIYLGVLIGASLLFFLPAIILVYQLTGSTNFTQQGLLTSKAIFGKEIYIIALLFAFGIAKAALIPVHKWLPEAMVAPTPVSALLHAVAVVKAGVFCLTKIIFCTIGASAFAASNFSLLGASNPILFIALFTIITASIFALRAKSLKQLLAYSTISQLSYITAAACLLSPASSLVALKAASVQMVAHSVAKISLFFCAGAIASATGKKYITELNGVGKKLRFVSIAFLLASLSIIGLPFLAGGIGKELIFEAGAYAKLGWINWIFYASMALSAGYYLPISYRLFCKPSNDLAVGKLVPITMILAIAITLILTLSFSLYYGYILELAEQGTVS